MVHDLPTDLQEALAANDTALAAWQDITPLARNEFICWVEDAKQQQTRERRIRAHAGEQLDSRLCAARCCRPGCQRPSSAHRQGC